MEKIIIITLSVALIYVTYLLLREKKKHGKTKFFMDVEKSIRKEQDKLMDDLRQKLSASMLDKYNHGKEN